MASKGTLLFKIYYSCLYLLQGDPSRYPFRNKNLQITGGTLFSKSAAPKIKQVSFSKSFFHPTNQMEGGMLGKCSKIYKTT